MLGRRALLAMGVFAGAAVSLPALAGAVNTLCPVKKIAVNPKVPAVQVNGRSIGFC